MSHNPFAETPEHNPYVPPAPASGQAANPLLPPGICLLVLSLAYLLLIVMSLPTQIAEITSRDTSTPEGMGEATGQAGFVIVMFLLQSVLVYGAIGMIRQKGYSAAFTAAIIAVIPICSPCFVLGIPFGIWAIVLLLKPEVRESLSA